MGLVWIKQSIAHHLQKKSSMFWRSLGFRDYSILQDIKFLLNYVFIQGTLVHLLKLEVYLSDLWASKM